MNTLRSIAGALCFGVTAFGLSVSTANAATITLSTSTNQFLSGTDNHGWWSDTLSNSTINDNYFTGTSSGSVLRSFFTFDLPSLTGETVVSATLRLRRYDAVGDGAETLEFFDVSTDAATLNNNAGTNASIFADLGGGSSYGTFGFNTGAGNTNTIFDIALNSTAITDIHAAAGGFFSIGGSLITNDGNDRVFSSSGPTGVQDLVLTTVAVPEPATLTLFGLGFLGLGVGRRRKAA